MEKKKIDLSNKYLERVYHTFEAGRCREFNRERYKLAVRPDPNLAYDDVGPAIRVRSIFRRFGGLISGKIEAVAYRHDFLTEISEKDIQGPEFVYTLRTSNEDYSKTNLQLTENSFFKLDPFTRSHLPKDNEGENIYSQIHIVSADPDLRLDWRLKVSLINVLAEDYFNNLLNRRKQLHSFAKVSDI